MSFEPSKAFMEQATFLASADELLAQAEKPETELKDAVDSAQQVLDQLGNIATEKLVIQPPLSEEQIAGYTKSAKSIVGIGQKALGSLEKADTEREATQQGDSVQGKGDEAKAPRQARPTPKPKAKKPSIRKPKGK